LAAVSGGPAAPGKGTDEKRSPSGDEVTRGTGAVEEVAQMARVNVRCWQETYRGLVSDAVLDDPGFLAARERFWLLR
jgi:hypothetical protein